jgi:phosphotransferase system HPr-like phosphotransfer protein
MIPKAAGDPREVWQAQIRQVNQSRSYSEGSAAGTGLHSLLVLEHRMSDERKKSPGQDRQRSNVHAEGRAAMKLDLSQPAAKPARKLMKPAKSLDARLTEQRNPLSTRIDQLSTIEIVDLINAEDRMVAAAVGEERQQIARAIDLVVQCLRQGGRLIYVGAGTSGRLGVLDA